MQYNDYKKLKEIEYIAYKTFNSNSLLEKSTDSYLFRNFFIDKHPFIGDIGTSILELNSHFFYIPKIIEQIFL